jgi:hypothetical protein
MCQAPSIFSLRDQAARRLWLRVVATALILLPVDSLFAEESAQCVSALILREKGAPPIVSVSINHRERKLLVDTGSQTSQFDLSMKADLGKSTGRGYIEYRNSKVSGLLYAAPILDCGRAELKTDSPVICLKVKQRLNELTGIELDGVLGLDYLRKWVLAFDFAKYQMSFQRSLSDDLRRGEKVPLIVKNGRPYVSCQIDGRNVDCLVDTGGIGFLGLADADFEKMPSDAKGLISADRVEAKICREFALGTFKHKNVFVGNTGEFESSIGLHVLNRYRVALDFESGGMYLLPNRDAFEPDHTQCDGALPAYVEVEGKSVLALAILRGSRAEDAGLKTLDVLIAINGKRAGSLSLPAIERLWSQRGSEDVQLLVRRNCFDDDELNDEEVTITIPGK